MDEILLLRGIRPTWVNDCTSLLSATLGPTAHSEIRNQIELFADLMEHAIESGNMSWFDSIIEDWASSLTTTDMENKQANLCLFVQQLSQITRKIFHQMLPAEHNLLLLNATIPCFDYVFVKAAEFEIQSRVRYASEQLSLMQQKMERLDRTKSDFISVASHELRTPLTLIEGYASILHENFERLFPEESQATSPNGNIQLLDGIHNGALRLRGIVDDMVDVSMIDNNLLSLNFQPVWINRLFVALRNEFRESLQERHQTLDILDFPGSNDMTYGDPERLLQVFRNILVNAVKYTPDHKTIQVNGRKLPGFIEVLIHDEGIGIAPEDIQRIFEKFFRVGDPILHSSGKTKFKGGGPGLGLHIAKGIIEAHGGAVWAESPGYNERTFPGSIFHILIPLRNQPPNLNKAGMISSRPPSSLGKENLGP